MCWGRGLAGRRDGGSRPGAGRESAPADAGAAGDATRRRRRPGLRPGDRLDRGSGRPGAAAQRARPAGVADAGWPVAGGGHQRLRGSGRRRPHVVGRCSGRRLRQRRADRGRWPPRRLVRRTGRREIPHQRPPGRSRSDGFGFRSARAGAGGLLPGGCESGSASAESCTFASRGDGCRSACASGSGPEPRTARHSRRVHRHGGPELVESGR